MTDQNAVSQSVLDKTQVGISALDVSTTNVEVGAGHYDKKREDMWQAIYTKQQTKIKMQKQRI